MMVALLGSCALAACQDAGADSSAETATRIDTIAGVPHVVNTGDGAWSDGGAWRVDSARAVVIGALDGPDEYVFGRVSGVTVADDGRVYVADMQANEIRMFSAGGEFIGRIGREGEGPGEFRNISGIGIGPDGGVAALDARLARVTVFGPDGAYGRSFRIARPYTIIADGAPVRFDSAGRFYDRTDLSTSSVDSIGIVRYSPEGAVQDTILTAAYEPLQFDVVQDGVRRMSFGIRYAPKPSSSVGPDGRIFTTNGAEYVIVQLSPAGDTLRVIRRDVVPPELTAEEREAELTRLRQNYEDVTGASPRDLPSLPERKPAISQLRVDDTGHLWVLRPTTDGRAWDVFEPEGRYLGAVSLPAMRVLHIGPNAVAGVTFDEMGVQRVVVVPLSRD